MHRLSFTLGEVRSMTLVEALGRVERAWGVKLMVSVVREPLPPNNYGVYAFVDLVEEIHRAELGGLPGIMIPLLDMRMLSLEHQLVAAVAGWTMHADEHMSSLARPE